MLVRMKAYHQGYNAHPGDVVEVSDHMARALIAWGNAEPLDHEAVAALKASHQEKGKALAAAIRAEAEARAQQVEVAHGLRPVNPDSSGD